MISQTAEYALRAIVYMAMQPEIPMTSRQIADRTMVPAGYMSKVLQALGRTNLVFSRRGLNGGFLLTRSAKEITVLDVINAVDPIKRITTCPLGLESHGEELCPLHRRLDDAIAMAEKAYAGSTIAELADTSTKTKPLCE